jgi:hypothetical protein
MINGFNVLESFQKHTKHTHTQTNIYGRYPCIINVRDDLFSIFSFLISCRYPCIINDRDDLDSLLLERMPPPVGSKKSLELLSGGIISLFFLFSSYMKNSLKLLSGAIARAHTHTHTHIMSALHHALCHFIFWCGFVCVCVRARARAGHACVCVCACVRVCGGGGCQKYTSHEKGADRGGGGQGGRRTASVSKQA